MRKCVSMVAVASAAFGLAACSAPDHPREPAGSAQPLSGQAAASRTNQAHGAPVAVAPAAAAAPAVPAATGAVPGQPGSQNPQSAPGAGAHPAAGSAIGAPVLIPAGTTDVAPEAGRAQAAHAAAARAAGAAPALAPAPPRPAPPPPPPAQNRNAQDASAGAEPNMSATMQIVDAVAASRMDGKSVLLDFSASWCTACRALDKAMHTPKVQALLAQSYRVVHIDLGNADPAHMALASQYDALGTYGMPLLVVLNPDGTVRADSAHVGQPKYDEAGLAAWLTQWGPR